MMLTVNGNGWEQFQNHHMYGAQWALNVIAVTATGKYQKLYKENQRNKMQMSTYIYTIASLLLWYNDRDSDVRRHSQRVVTVQRPRNRWKGHLCGMNRHFFFFRHKNLKQEWLLAFWNKIQIKCSKECCLFGQNPTCKFSGSSTLSSHKTMLKQQLIS